MEMQQHSINGNIAVCKDQKNRWKWKLYFVEREQFFENILNSQSNVSMDNVRPFLIITILQKIIKNFLIGIHVELRNRSTYNFSRISFVQENISS